MRGLADAYAGLPVSTGFPAEDRPWRKRSRRPRQSLAIDPESSRSRECSGASLRSTVGTGRRPCRLFQRVFELNPSYAQAYHDYGFYLLAMNRVNDAITRTRKACMLDPLSVYFAADLAFNPYQLGNTDESIRQLRLTLAMDPAIPDHTHVYLCAGVIRREGEFDNALAAAKRSVELDPEDLFTTGTLGYVYGKAGKTRGGAVDPRTTARDLTCAQRASLPTTLHSFKLGLDNRELALDYLSGKPMRRGSISFR